MRGRSRAGLSGTRGQGYSVQAAAGPRTAAQLRPLFTFLPHACTAAGWERGRHKRTPLALPSPTTTRNAMGRVQAPPMPTPMAMASREGTAALRPPSGKPPLQNPPRPLAPPSPEVDMLMAALLLLGRLKPLMRLPVRKDPARGVRPEKLGEEPRDWNDPTCAHHQRAGAAYGRGKSMEATRWRAPRASLLRARLRGRRWLGAGQGKAGGGGCGQVAPLLMPGAGRPRPGCSRSLPRGAQLSTAHALRAASPERSTACRWLHCEQQQQQQGEGGDSPLTHPAAAPR